MAHAPEAPRRAAEVAGLDAQRRSVEASERRLRFHYDLAESKRGLTDSREMI